MNKKLEIGMYIRTKNHGIKKILNIGSYCGMNQYILDEEGNYTIGNGIIKSSHNLIDLIEDGDILRLENNQVVQIFPSDKEKIERFLIYNVDTKKYHWGAYEIKSIVTKEQFKSLEYEVK